MKNKTKFIITWITACIVMTAFFVVVIMQQRVIAKQQDQIKQLQIDVNLYKHYSQGGLCGFAKGFISRKTLEDFKKDK